MPTVVIKPDHKALDAYYQTLETLRQRQQVTHEGGLRRAFGELLNATASVKKWTLVEELSEKTKRNQRGIRLDGTLRDEWHLPHGYWEAKDEDDDLNVEIRHKRERGYPFDNIIFEDTETAVLFQDGLEVVRTDVHDREHLADLLTRFYNYEIEPFQKFDEAIAHFQREIPHIATSLKQKIEQAHADNKGFQTAFAAFMELCRTALNPNIRQEAVDEMLIQHMLTERIIRKVFDVENFTRRNVIAGEVENVIDKLTSRYFNRAEFLGALDRFYEAIEHAADRLATFADKQHFINTVYEKFFQGYSVEIADTHGIVYTPQEIVDFMGAAVEEVLHTEFGKKLGDDGVFVIDPCTGTGSFVVNLLRRAYASNPRHFERFYREQLFANEVMLMPYYIASLNIEHEYYELTGQYEAFEGVCFVDTLDLAEGAQMKLAFMTEANTERVERQKQAPITVILGNPPYNVGQLNENDNNKNRKYAIVDQRVSETYAKDSKASNKNALSDPYVKFFRWATDRLQGRDGVVCFVSNNSFVDQIAFDGMRKHLLQDFTQIYHVDLHGNVRQNPKLSGTTHNVFGIQVGVGITVAVRSALTPWPPLPHGEGEKATLYYRRVPEMWRKEEKLAYLLENVDLDGKHNSLNTVEWQRLEPDDRNTWLVPENADEFGTFIPTGSKETKSAKARDVKTIFRTFSNGVKTNRDTVVYDFDREQLITRVKQFVDDYNAEVDRYRRAGQPKNVDDFVDYRGVKWSRDLKLDLQRGNYAQYDENKVRLSLYRPFCRQYLFFDRILNEEVYVFPSIFPTPNSESENQVIIVGGYGRKDFAVALATLISDLNLYADPAQCFPFYVYDEDGGNRRENITDWALAQFRERYGTLTLNPSPSERGTFSDSPPRPASNSAAISPRPEGEGSGVRVARPEGEGPGVRVPRPEGEGPGVRVHIEQDEAVYRVRASAAMKQIARDLRQRQTSAEAILWECLRDRRLDHLKFRRQHALENSAYVVDFLCYEARLVVELDGEVHAGQVEADAVRQANIEALGYRVLRFPNEMVHADLESVLTSILMAARPFDSPRPEGEGPGVRVPRPEGEGSGVRVPRPEEAAHGSEVRVITKWDIFYYVYGLLHHPGYRERYADNLKRELPRIPFAPDFWAFSTAGRKLADLHLHYEDGDGYDLTWQTTGQQNFRVEKMRLSRDKTALRVNDYLTLTGLPAAAFAYRLGNRSALEWIVDQYQVKTDKRSGIVSDPNGYSANPRYIVELVEKVVRVSVATVQIVNELAALAFR